jgi:hypothetical protein
MKRYLTSLLVITVIFGALVFVTSVPFSKAGPAVQTECQQFCDDNVVCACSFVIGGNLRETSCRDGCPDPVFVCQQSTDIECTCDSKCIPPTKKGKVLEEGVQWLRYPTSTSAPLCPESPTC